MIDGSHVTIDHDGTKKSTVDLFTTWTLITLDDAWKGDVPSLYIPDIKDPTTELAKRYRIGNEGASLIRPDGVIAWRSTTPPTDPPTN